MIIVAGGDSFIWGSELHDSPHGGPAGWSNSTFTAILSKSNRYCCAAYPGYSNSEIVKSVISCCKEFSPDFVIVCWTWPGRDNAVDSDNHIQKLQDFLQQKSIGYLFTCADNCVVTGKLDYTNWYFFPAGMGPDQTETPRGFYQWARENKYTCGIEHHPLEQAHKDAAELMQGKFNELVKKHLQQNSTRNTIS